MKIIALMFGGFGLFAIGAVRILRGAPDPTDEHPDAAAQSAAYLGLASIVVAALAYYWLLLSGFIFLALPVPFLLGAYALSRARKRLTAVVAGVDYLAPLVWVWLFFGNGV